jgi:endonuclease/exonuclease/phosphatase family metal-dependent hydrolase
MANQEPMVVAAWNAFESLDTRRRDVLLLCTVELTRREGLGDQQSIRDAMGELGYRYGVITRGVRPDGLYMALWSREDVELGEVPVDNYGTLPYAKLPDRGTVLGVQNPHEEPVRQAVSRQIVTIAREHTTGPHDPPSDVIAVGDFNAARIDRRSPPQVRLLRAADHIARFGPQLFGITDHYSGPAWQRALDKFFRACSITSSQAVPILMGEGFQGTELDFLSTVHLWGLALPVDHVFVTPDYEVIALHRFERQKGRDGKYISDHNAIRAEIVRRGLAP